MDEMMTDYTDSSAPVLGSGLNPVTSKKSNTCVSSFFGRTVTPRLSFWLWLWLWLWLLLLLLLLCCCCCCCCCCFSSSSSFFFSCHFRSNFGHPNLRKPSFGAPLERSMGHIRPCSLNHCHIFKGLLLGCVFFQLRSLRRK